MNEWKQKLIDYWENIRVNNEKGEKYQVMPTGWRKESHIPYTGDYHPMHVLNLYYPAGWDASKGKLPTIIDIHGGGWLYGTVDESERYLAWLAAQGYAVMGMSYRLLDETDLSGIISDIYDAMHWLEQFGPDRGFDMGKALLTGDSAGGHLSGLVACIQKNPELQKAYGVVPFSFEISALCVCCPCSEMDRLYIMDREESEAGQKSAEAYYEMMLGDRGDAAPWKGKMSLSEAMRGIKLPPLLLIGSETESLYEQSEMLLRALEAEGQDHETLIWKKEEAVHLQHVFNISHWEWRESIISNKRMLEFFDKAVKND